MVLNKLTERWTKGQRLVGNYLLSTGTYRGEQVIFVMWPQGDDVVLTYVRKSDFAPDDPCLDLFNLGADPHWFEQDEFAIRLNWVGDYNTTGIAMKPRLESDKYRLNEPLVK